MAWNALVENREGENLTNAIESSDIGNKTLCLHNVINLNNLPMEKNDKPNNLSNVINLKAEDIYS